MSTENDDKLQDDAIYRVDTIPPPAGEGDAYSAPTKVGPMEDSLTGEGEAMAHLGPAGLTSAPPAFAAGVVAPASDDVAIPRVFDDVYEDGAETILSPKAKTPRLPATAAAAGPVTAAPPALARAVSPVRPAPRPQISAPSARMAAAVPQGREAPAFVPAPPAAPVQRWAPAGPAMPAIPATFPPPTTAEPGLSQRLVVTLAVCSAVFVVGLLMFMFID